MDKGTKTGPIEGLSIPRASNALQFRTKDNTLVATGYEKVLRDDSGVVRVYFKTGQVCERNLVEAEPQGPEPSFNVSGDPRPAEPAPARYISTDAAKVEFLRAFRPLFATAFDHRWKAAAADLYVDGEPVYKPESKSGPMRTAQIGQLNRGGKKPSSVTFRTDFFRRG